MPEYEEDRDELETDLKRAANLAAKELAEFQQARRHANKGKNRPRVTKQEPIEVST